MDLAPVVVKPSQAWDGNDGPWSTFALGFGTPPQYVRVLISTTCPQPWAIDPIGCATTDPPECPNRRGNIFYKNSSSTWQDKGLYGLDEELNLGYTGNGNFGLDSITLGYPGSGAPTIGHQLLATIATRNFDVATWGIAPRTTNLTRPGQKPVTFASEDAYPSLLSTLKVESKIPSISYGYTAGARYSMCLPMSLATSKLIIKGLKQVPASLTLGGFDASRFASSNLTLGFADDVSRDLVVGIQSISVAGSDEILLPKPILSFVDATVSHIWLPVEACKAFERAFGITFDTVSGLYLVNETLHRDLLARNATVVFIIGADTVSPPTVNISLPYAAFDLQLTAYPNILKATRYFPLRRAANDTQHTLGRTFLQEAYLIADYERSQFSINQCRFVGGLPADIQAISSPNSTNITVNPDSPTISSAGGLSSAIIATIVVVPIVILAVLGLILTIQWRRKRQASEQSDQEDSETASKVAASVSGVHELHEDRLAPPELHDIPKTEMDGGFAAAEVNATEANVHEME
ncbi:MAG: hypothetical protein Q9207_001295 [Kuettlingeria erythrocarpa]